MRTIVPILLFGLFSISHAQELDSGPYIGIGLASFNYEESLSGFGSFDDSTSATKIYGGYQFNETWAVEGSWESSGTVEQTSTLTIPPFAPITTRLGADFEALTVRGVGFLPFSWGDLFGGIGYYDGDSAAFAEVDDGMGTVIRVEGEGSDNGLTLLGGVQWDFSSISLRLEYEWWDIDGGDATAIGAGFHWRF